MSNDQSKMTIDWEAGRARRAKIRVYLGITQIVLVIALVTLKIWMALHV